MKTLYLLVEVQKSAGAVDVVKGGKAGHCAVDAHGMDTQHTTVTHEEPVGVGATDEHLKYGTWDCSTVAHRMVTAHITITGCAHEVVCHVRSCLQV